LGHLYAAESLVLLNRINDALPHLHPDNISKLSNFPPSENDSVDRKYSQGQQKNKLTWKHIHIHILNNYKRNKNYVLYLFIFLDWFPVTTQSAKVVLQYNLSTVYALRGEFEKAGELVRQVCVQF
jgi:CCR4-NOT transcription complex subunit 10